ncbi:MAG TPA: FBP domain-containing protein [Arthrobacter sp.]|nr:FBP domain-containing protein [Arthrobacter sp.]
MEIINEKSIRASFVNASRREAAQLPIPKDLHKTDWENTDFLAWTDPRNGQRSYAVVPIADRVVGMVLTTAQTGSKQAMCSWCEDIIETSDVKMFSAKLAGAAGRKGNTVGTMIHDGFGCPRFARRMPTPQEGGDPEQFVATRVAKLRTNAGSFARRVAGLR